MPSPRLRDLLAEKDALRELDGWQVKKALFGLRRSLGVFEGNSGRLVAFLGQHGDARTTHEALETLEFQNRAGFEKYLDETDRLLHNFLAAAESLRDHMQAIQKKHLPDLPDDPDTSEYQARKSEVFDSPAGSFVRELRQHVLHERIPETGGYAVWGSEPGDLTAGIALDRSELQAARQWSKEATRYMRDAGGDILIHEVAGEFREQVVELREWFDAALRRRNADVLKELETREAEVGEALKKAWGPPIDDPMDGPNGPAPV
jgi:hypothetical protein